MTALLAISQLSHNRIPRWMACGWAIALLLSLAQTAGLRANSDSSTGFGDTWANWEKKWDRAFEKISMRKLPGRTMGIYVPADTRPDLYPMTAFGYQSLLNERIETVVFILPAFSEMQTAPMMMPGFDTLDTSIGVFAVNKELRAQIQASDLPVSLETDPFYPTLPRLLETQLAALKYALKGKLARISVLPIAVKFTDLNSQVKDYAPMLADKIRDLGLEGSIKFVVAGDLTQSTFEQKLIEADNLWITALRNLDVEGIIGLNEKTLMVDKDLKGRNVDPVAMGTLTMRWLGADHAVVFAYAHSGQLILSKDKINLVSYISAGVATEMPFTPRIQHVNREHMVEIFSEILRSDLLAMTRQTCASVLDPTAAKPPSLEHKQAAKKWPVYVSIYDPQGALIGQAGSHIAVGPLEESIRQFAFEAVHQAKTKLNKEIFQKCIVDVSVPYGFIDMQHPEELIPHLNGVIVTAGRKTSAWHPDGWRTYSDAHQMLAAICFKLGLEPWSYANHKAGVESFRVLSFNEKEPFQDLSGSSGKKKKKKGSEDPLMDDFGGESQGGTGAFPF